MRHLLPITAMVLTLIVLVPAARAQVNGFPVCSDNSNQTGPEMVADGAGGVIITWVDARNGANQTKIYAQRLNAAGTPQWAFNGVAVSVLLGNDASPCIVSDGAGGAIIAWQHNTPGGIISAQRLNSTGALQWPTAGPKNGVQLTISGSGSTPVIASDGANGAIVVWRDARGALGTYDIYAARATSAGLVPWTSGGVAVCNATNDQILPVTVSDAAGGAIVAWFDQRTGFDIYTERLNGSGALQWGTGTGVLMGTSTSVADAPSITGDGAGGAIVAWETDTVNHDIIARRVNAVGVPQWGGGTLVCTAANPQLHPQIVSDGAFGALITWQDGRTNPNWDVYVQRVDAAGAAQWAPNGVALTNNYAESPVITGGASGGALVTWVDTRDTPTTQHNLYARAVTASGTPGFPADGTPVCTAVDDQIAPRIAYSGSNAFLTWQDRRSGGWDIYAFMMSVTTAVGDTPAPFTLSLGPNHPNPFLERTAMNLDLAVRRDVKIDVFDVAGHRVRHDDLGHMNAGRREITFDGRDDRGAALPSGVYFYRVHAGNETLTKKMVIAR